MSSVDDEKEPSGLSPLTCLSGPERSSMASQIFLWPFSVWDTIGSGIGADDQNSPKLDKDGQMCKEF